MAEGIATGVAADRVAERLYYDSAELDFKAVVTDIRLVATELGEAGEKTQVWQVALDRTAFYPESGGQPWDIGVLTATARSGATISVPVERVEEDAAGEVWHTLRKPLVAGTEIVGRVNAERRHDHMQQHSGQHLLSAVFLAELGARTVSFHLGVESSTVDLALPERVKEFSAEQMERVETEANRLIFEDRAMTPHWHSRSEVEAMLADGRLRKLPERPGPMRVIEMSGVEFNACGGTHVRSTGAIGGLLLRRVEKVKAGWRVEFVCGLRAVRTARRDYLVLGAVAASLSVGAAAVPARVAALQEETKSAGKRLRALLEELADARAAALVADLAPGVVLQAVFTEKPVEFAKAVASWSTNRGRASVVGVQEEKAGAVVLSVPSGTGLHAGNLLREALAAQGARGGGSADLAQGVCESGQVAGLVSMLAAKLASGTATPHG